MHVLPDSVDNQVEPDFRWRTAPLIGLKLRARLQAGETLLVHGAAGGVGLTAVEIGKRLGATVIATAGGAEKLQIAADAGADHLIDSRTGDVRETVKALTDGRGADVVYDPVGGALFDASLRCTAPGGRILLVGFASGDVPQIPANILMVKNIDAIGFYWGAHRVFAPELMTASFEELLTWLGEGSLKPHVSGTYPLDDAPKALQDFEGTAHHRQGRADGRIIERMNDDPVRAQYEAYPYPVRDPADEAKRLITGSPSHIDELNYYVFERAAGISPNRSEPLSPAAGTGDATIMLAQQLARVRFPGRSGLPRPLRGQSDNRQGPGEGAGVVEYQICGDVASGSAREAISGPLITSIAAVCCTT